MDRLNFHNPLVATYVIAATLTGFLYVLTEPSLLLARVLLYGYVVSRLRVRVACNVMLE